MTATLPSPTRPAAKALPRNPGAGTLVRVENETGIFRISSPAGWGGPNHTTPTSYNLVGPDGRIVSAVPAARVSIQIESAQDLHLPR